MSDEEYVYLGTDMQGRSYTLSRKIIREQLTRFGVGGWVELEDDGTTPDDMFEAAVSIWREEASKMQIGFRVIPDEARTKRWTF